MEQIKLIIIQLYHQIAKCLRSLWLQGVKHSKLVWARTKTLGRGDEYCDFRLYIVKSKEMKPNFPKSV